MEVILDCFFDNFSQLERNTLHARYKRRAMAEYIGTIIEACCKDTGNPQIACRYAVLSIVRYHQKSLRENNDVCLMGKYHNVLYVAASLCYSWQLDDSATIVALLDNIYACEKTFERLWMGAIFGINAPFYVTGWKSDFKDREENLRAMVYFLHHSNVSEALYCNETEKTDQELRFVDVPLESCGKSAPLKMVVQLGRCDVAHILLRFGARCDRWILAGLLIELCKFNRQYPYNFVSCLQHMLKTIPTVDLTEMEYLTSNSPIERETRRNEFLWLVEDGIIPPRMHAKEPAELKHLCRCTIRDVLWSNHQLPNGIRSLPVPEVLHKYLDLMTD